MHIMEFFDWIVNKSKNHIYAGTNKEEYLKKGNPGRVERDNSPPNHGYLSRPPTSNSNSSNSNSRNNNYVHSRDIVSNNNDHSKTANSFSVEFQSSGSELEDNNHRNHYHSNNSTNNYNYTHNTFQHDDDHKNDTEITSFLTNGEKREILLYYLLENFYSIHESEKKRLYYFLLQVAESGQIDFDPFIKMPLHTEFINQLNRTLDLVNRQHPHTPQPQVTLYPSSSTYAQQFDEISFLGKGGYGHVVKAQNHMDGMMYAVKKVKFRDFADSVRKLDKVLREVKALAQLDHINVLRYYHAWLQAEEEFLPTAKPNMSIDIASEIEDSTTTNNNDNDNDNDDDNDDDDDNDEKEEEVKERSPDLHLVPYQGIRMEAAKKRYVLYIQMQLCEGKSLKDFLERTNREVDFDENLRLFSQVIAGIHHIHARGLIHRDIKPDNIFLTAEGIVKIGDFGLAKKIQEFSVVDSGEISLQDSAHTAGVGTRTYVSPEQLQGRCYNEKADIYSLGILLFELFSKFSTSTERAKTLQNLRDGLIDDVFWAKYPSVAAFVLLLMREDPDHRPSTSEILKSKFLNTFTVQSTEYSEVFTLVQKQQEEIMNLQKKVKYLEDMMKKCNITAEGT